MVAVVLAKAWLISPWDLRKRVSQYIYGKSITDGVLEPSEISLEVASAKRIVSKVLIINVGNLYQGDLAHGHTPGMPMICLHAGRARGKK